MLMPASVNYLLIPTFVSVMRLTLGAGSLYISRLRRQLIACVRIEITNAHYLREKKRCLTTEKLQ